MSNILELFRVDGRVAVITGASSGLGAGFARALAEAGADVVLAARRVDRLHEVSERVGQTGRRVHVRETDVRDPDQCTALVESAIAQFGRVDILVNNAGIGTAVPALRETPEEFRRVVDVNLHGAYWMAQACGRVMEPGSSIVNVASEMTAEIPEDKLMSFIESTTPLARFGQQREIDTAVLFLASPAASYITGTTLAVDGGMADH